MGDVSDIGALRRRKIIERKRAVKRKIAAKRQEDLFAAYMNSLSEAIDKIISLTEKKDDDEQ
jgi:hypothetical protein